MILFKSEINQVNTHIFSSHILISNNVLEDRLGLPVSGYKSTAGRMGIPGRTHRHQCQKVYETLSLVNPMKWIIWLSKLKTNKISSKHL